MNKNNSLDRWKNVGKCSLFEITKYVTKTNKIVVIPLASPLVVSKLLSFQLYTCVSKSRLSELNLAKGIVYFHITLHLYNSMITILCLLRKMLDHEYTWHWSEFCFYIFVYIKAVQLFVFIRMRVSRTTKILFFLINFIFNIIHQFYASCTNVIDY